MNTMNTMNSMNDMMIPENVKQATLKDIVNNISAINRETSAELKMIYEALMGPERTTEGESSDNRDPKSLLQLLVDEQMNAKNNLDKIIHIREVMW